MKEIQGGRIQGCAQYMQVGIAYVGGCCTGLSACYVVPQNHDLYCVPPSECNDPSM